MDASYVNIRIKNNYGQNDMRFSLSGSTKAIKYVIPYDTMLARELEIKERKLAAIRAREAILHIRDSAIIDNLKNELNQDLVEDLILAESIHQYNFYGKNVRFKSGMAKVNRGQCIERELSMVKVSLNS